MNYKNYFEKTMEALKEYEKSVDVLIPQYQAEVSRHNAELESMKGKYTDSYIAEERAKWKPSKDYQRLLDAEREKRSSITEHYLELLKKNLDGYFNSPVSQEFANKITSIKLMGLQLTNREFMLLQESAVTYMERRLLGQLADNRTKNETRTVLNQPKLDGNQTVSGALETVRMDVGNPFSGVDVPDIESIYRVYEEMKNNVHTGLQWYCGEELQFKEFVGYDGGDFGSIAGVTHAAKCFDVNKNTSYQTFLSTMEKAVGILPQSKVKQKLTEKDRKFIDALIPAADYEKYPTLARGRAVEMARVSAEVASLLLLDSRYKEDVEKALSE